MGTSFDGLTQDVRQAVRALRASPGFALAAVATLALGIAINGAVFTVTNAILFKGFRSIEGNDRILYIGTQKDGRGCCVSYPDFADWRAELTSFEDLGAVADLRVAFNDASGAAESYTATQITANTFHILGQTPIVGRDFGPQDERPGAAGVAILSYGFWQRRYALDPSVIGRTVRINGAPTVVIGVMAHGFSFPQNQDLWLPLVPTPNVDKRDARGLWFAFGRMREGMTFARARAELDAVGARLAAAYPRTNEGWVPQPLTFAEFFIARNAATAYGAMWGAVGFVLLIACANLANLSLARALGRSREISVRIALGARRSRIVRQLLIESTLLAVASGIIAWWITGWGVRAYGRFANPPTRAWSQDLIDYTMDGRVLLYLTAISILTGLLCGLAPALRLSTLDVHRALKEGGRSASGSRRGRQLASLLVISEMALAVVLLTGAGVLMRSFVNISSADIGVNAADTLTLLVNLPEAKYPDAHARVSFFDRLTTRLEAIPGIASVSVASSLPTGGSSKLPYEIDSAPVVDPGRRPMLSALTIGPAYFRTLGVDILLGRDFNRFDSETSVPVAIVNERFATTHWAGESAIGKRVHIFGGPQPLSLTVIGVVPNIVQDDASRSRRAFDPLIYVPLSQRPAPNMWAIARARVDPVALAVTFRREVQSIDPNLPIWLGPFTLAERLAGSGNYWSTGNAALLFAIFAATALLLASVGLYGVLAQSVGQRTQEIGIRMAIGGTARAIFAAVCRQGMTHMAIGLVVGLGLSIALVRVLTSSLVHVSSADPLTYAIASAVLAAAAMLGCAIPARRAMRVDPVVALRQQ